MQSHSLSFFTLLLVNQLDGRALNLTARARQRSLCERERRLVGRTCANRHSHRTPVAGAARWRERDAVRPRASARGTRAARWRQSAPCVPSSTRINRLRSDSERHCQHE